MIGDFVCLLLLTPLATVSCWLCLAGAVHYAEIGRTKVELPGLICLALFLLVTYSVWLSVRKGGDIAPTLVSRIRGAGQERLMPQNPCFIPHLIS